MNSYKRPVISFHNLNFRFAVMIKQALFYGSRSVSTPEPQLLADRPVATAAGLPNHTEILL